MPHVVVQEEAPAQGMAVVIAAKQGVEAALATVDTPE